MTAKRLEIHPEAVAEAESALDWYAIRSERAPKAFLNEIESAIADILAAPNNWPLVEKNCRKFPLYRFPYSIIYRSKSEDLIQSLQSPMVVGDRGIGARESLGLVS
jgi:ParE toxin of type II toxin-antitoxin system, parDE